MDTKWGNMEGNTPAAMDPPGQADMSAAPVTYAAFAGTCFSPAPTPDQAAHLAERLEDRRSLQQPTS